MIKTFIAWAKEEEKKDVERFININPTSYKANEWGMTITLFDKDFMKIASLYVACASSDDATNKCLELLK